MTESNPHGERAAILRTCPTCNAASLDATEACETCRGMGVISVPDAVETWFNLTPGYREAILREHGLVPPWERKPPTRWQRIVRFFRGY